METKTNLFICQVVFVDDEEFNTHNEWVICNAKNFAKCTHELEFMYGKGNIISMKMAPLEEGPIVITEALAKRFIETEWGQPIN